MTVKKYITASVAVLLAVVAIVYALPLDAASTSDYDLSRPGSPHTRVLDSADIISEYLSCSLTAAESEYLSLYGDLRLSYDCGITTSRVLTDYEDGTLYFSVRDYSYLTEDGVTVTWIPTSITLGDDTLPLVMQDDRYEAVFTEVVRDESLIAYVDYSLDVLISAADMNAVINKAYNDAPRLEADIERRREEYLELSERYAADIITYEEYLVSLAEYEADYAVYAEYLSRKKLYDDALAEYNGYLTAMEEYEAASERYAEYQRLLGEYNEAYVKYREYLTVLDGYNGELEIYNEYLERIGLARAQLAVIDAVKTPMTDKRDVYSAIMGSLVTQVVENKDLIASSLVGASEAVIDDAGRATNNLRSMLQSYFALTDEQDKYAYYTVNYEALRDNFSLLLRTLDELYQNKRVRGTLIAEKKDKKYIILVAQLAVIANALDEGTVSSYYGEYLFDDKYTIEGQTIAQILENKEYFSDTGAPEPLTEGYPTPVAEPTAPTPVPEPQKPAAVAQPILPEPIGHPGEPPAPMDAPITPETVTEPVEPVEYVPEEEVVALISAYRAGELSPRPELSEDYTLTLDLRLKKQVFGAAAVTVEFRDPEGELLYLTSVDRGSAADYEGALPYRAPDAAATYTFVGWVDGEGAPASLDAVESDLILYPSFLAEPKYYDITFDVDGALHTQSLPYGSLPVFDGKPTRAPGDSSYFVFTGWDITPSAVVGDALYRAEFDEMYYLPFSEGGGAELSREGGYILADCVRSASSRLELAELARLAVSSELGVRLDTRFSGITLPYSVLMDMLEQGDTVITVSVVQSGIHGYSYEITLTDGESTVPDRGYRLSVSTPSVLTDPDRARMFYLSDEGERVYCSYSYSDGAVSYYHNTQKTYSLIYEYSVNPLPAEGTTLSSSHSTAKPGEWVNVSITANDGVELKRVYLTLEDGSEQEIVGGKFRMPACDVNIVVSAVAIKYRVTFMNKDKILLTSLYEWGDRVIPPKAPERASNDLYSFTFAGWSPEVGQVTGDAVYSATWELHLLPIESDPDELHISDGILARIVIAASLAGLLLFAAIPSVIILAVSLRRYRRWRTGAPLPVRKN